MTRYLLAATATLGCFALMASEAGAVVCGAGPYRAGCAAPNGAVVARRPVGGYYGAPGYYRPPVYVAPAPVYLPPPAYYYPPPVYYPGY